LWTATGVAGAGLAASVLHLGRPLRAWRIFLGLRRSWLSREAIVFGAWFPALAAAAMFPSERLFAGAALGLGLVGVFCSVMIYADTGRQLWRFAPTSLRFFGSAAVLGLALTHPATGAVAVGIKLAAEVALWRRAPALSRLVVGGPLRRILATRWLSGALAVGCLALASVEPGAGVIGLLALALGELLDRRLFFQAVDPSRMPGIPAT
ncbi:MAG TPA: DmsC/YnfH family molybdoenzyme membrane anchor subunit, partial [Candidatus Synoicihabitans sp.]|nr:DmsC/YnfH family molybdoenzyme membrane anchor subunit [Candidatus Synoicihabitans sp.]